MSQKTIYELGALFCAILFITTLRCAASEIVLEPSVSVANISNIEMPILKRQALSGSIAAAKQLGTYFLWKMHNSSEGNYWRTVQAENGDLDARLEIALSMGSLPNVESRIRARFWLELIVAEGAPELASRARDGLKQIDQMDAQFKESSR